MTEQLRIDTALAAEDVLVGEEDMEDDEEEIDFVDDGCNLDADTRRFDQMVGALADLLMDPDFEAARETFCRSNCHHFEDSDENKLIYTELFEQYVSLVEQTIDTEMQEAVPDFSMQEFSALLSKHEEQLSADVFDLLLSLGDFELFKELMMSYKKEASEGRLELSCMAMKLHAEEMEEGDERPDLDLGLVVSPMGQR